MPTKSTEFADAFDAGHSLAVLTGFSSSARIRARRFHERSDVPDHDQPVYPLEGSRG